MARANSKIKIIQWNCKSIIFKQPEITHMVKNTKIFFFSETWLTTEMKFSIPHFEIIRKDRLSRKGEGVAIGLKKGIKYFILENIYDCEGKIEVCAAQLYLNSGHLILVSYYRPPGGPIIPSASWEKFLNQFHDKVIIGGDFNSHHMSWVGTKFFRSGEKLLEGIENAHLTIANNGNATFFDAIHQRNQPLI